MATTVRVGTDVRANPGAHRPAACAADVGLIYVAIVERKSTGDVRLDDEKHPNQRQETTIGARVSGEWGALPTFSGIRIAVEVPDGYSDGWTWR